MSSSHTEPKSAQAKTAEQGRAAPLPGARAPDSELESLLSCRHADPALLLGRHTNEAFTRVRVLIPPARHVFLDDPELRMERIDDSGLFEWQGAPERLSEHYLVHWSADGTNFHSHYDPYNFPPQIPLQDLELFQQGEHWRIYQWLGAHSWRVGDVEGVLFATWAPNAERVSLVADFNAWDGRRHMMRCRGASGVWELFIPEAPTQQAYKYEIRNRESGEFLLKADPFARQFELRPRSASLIPASSDFSWQDADWMREHKQPRWLHAPLSIYEVHLGSWQRDAEGGFLNYRELAHRLVPYALELGFTHIELLPIAEFPFDGSWGYQCTGYYAPTSRFGNPDDLRYFVDYCHRHGIGVLLDWVVAHFPKDSHGLARYDGTALYEHSDPRMAEHADWGTLIFNYDRNEVSNFLIANALYWMDEFHIDGLRVDAVASMLYLDYSRQPGQWTPNIYGGNENLGAVRFLRRLNEVAHQYHPGALMIAEESTSWPQVSRPTYLGGLGFSMKWNMGWMHDSLSYMSKDPIHRHFHHDQLTFGMLYAYNENFVLPFSHDEVVHGKASLLSKMPGDEWQRFANLRLLYSYMFSYPGKKLLFMGDEFGQGREWNHDQPLDWYVLDYPLHRGLRKLVADLNHCYRELPALHQYDFDPRGFAWIDCHDAQQSVISYLRRSDTQTVVIVLNFTPVPRLRYRVGLPALGSYRERINSDATLYGGSNLGNSGWIEAETLPWANQPYSAELIVPPLAGLILVKTD